MSQLNYFYNRLVDLAVDGDVELVKEDKVWSIRWNNEDGSRCNHRIVLAKSYNSPEFVTAGQAFKDWYDGARYMVIMSFTGLPEGLVKWIKEMKA